MLAGEGGVELLLELPQTSNIAAHDIKERLRQMAWGGVREAFEAMEEGPEKGRCFLEIYALGLDGGGSGVLEEERRFEMVGTGDDEDEDEDEDEDDWDNCVD